MRPRADEVFPEPLFRRLGGALTVALAGCGVHGLVTRGVSDLCLGDRKVVGSSLRLWRDRALFQASVLVAADVSLFERYLRMPSLAPAYRAGRRHAEFVTTLAAAGHAVTTTAVGHALREAFAVAGDG